MHPAIRCFAMALATALASPVFGGDCDSVVSRQQRLGLEMISAGIPQRGDTGREKKALASGNTSAAHDYVVVQSSLWSFLGADADAGTRARAWLIYSCITKLPTERIYVEAEHIAKQCGQEPADTLDRAMQCFINASKTVTNVPAVQPLPRYLPEPLKAATIGLPAPFEFVFSDVEFIGAVRMLVVDSDSSGSAVTYSFDRQARLIRTDYGGAKSSSQERAYDVHGYEITNEGPTLMRVNERETAVKYGNKAIVLGVGGRISHWGYVGSHGRFQRHALFRYSGDRLTGIVVPELLSLCIPGPCAEEEFSITESRDGDETTVVVTSSRRSDYNFVTTYRNGRAIAERRMLMRFDGAEPKKARALCTASYKDDAQGNWVERTETCDQFNFRKVTKRIIQYF